MDRVTCMVVVVSMVLAAASYSTAAQMPCSDTVNVLLPCATYLVGTAPSDRPSPQCCQSVRALNKMATTAASRRAPCECLKQTGSTFGINPERASKLSTFCKLNITISLSDCNKKMEVEAWCSLMCAQDILHDILHDILPNNRIMAP